MEGNHWTTFSPNENIGTGTSSSKILGLTARRVSKHGGEKSGSGSRSTPHPSSSLTNLWNVRLSSSPVNFGWQVKLGRAKWLSAHSSSVNRGWIMFVKCRAKSAMDARGGWIDLANNDFYENPSRSGFQLLYLVIGFRTEWPMAYGLWPNIIRVFHFLLLGL